MRRRGSGGWWRLGLGARGVLGPLQAPAAIQAQGFTAPDWPTVEAMRAKAFVGSASDVAMRLDALADALAVEEIVVTTWAYDPAVRRTSYALLAEAFGLARVAPTAQGPVGVTSLQ